MQWILIQPEYEYNIAFPLSLAHVATFLKKKMTERVLCYDLNLQSFEDTISHIRENSIEPDVFGFSATSITKENTLDLCSKVKQIFPKTKTIIGGAAAQIEYKELLQNKFVDFCFIRDIEQIGEKFDELINADDLKSLPGVAFIQGSKIKENEAAPLTALDDFPFPDRKLSFIHIENYRPPDVIKEHHPATLVTSRGCPHNCTYCASARISGQRTIWRSTESVVEELDYLRGLGYNSFVFEDYEFLFNIPRAEKICKNLRAQSSKWILKTRVEKINEATAAMLAESGCLVVYIGVETLTKRAIEEAKKTTVNVQSVKNAVYHLKNQNIRVCASIQFGLPGDTETEFIDNTVKFLSTVLDPDRDMVQLHFTTLFPGTALYDEYFPEANYVNIHNIFSHVIAHGFEGYLMPGLSEDTIKRVYEKTEEILGKLLTEKGIWFSH